ncbi:MAG: hypothetical protein MJ180_04025 [Candidatus Gastranaerophilales bacterium]|nr:hypothetical protein [Candidatus Gastranaerophilales bacterium]
MTASLATADRLTTAGSFAQGGNGKYKGLKNRKPQLSKKNSGAYDPFNPAYNRMRFKNSRDPIYIAFDHIDKQSPLKLTTDLIKDGIESSINTIGKTLISLFN